MQLSIQTRLHKLPFLLQLQVSACGEDPSFHHAPDQVQFIRTLCLRLTKDPRLADLFMKVNLTILLMTF